MVFMSPAQAHKLQNGSRDAADPAYKDPGDFCATVQCYKYGMDDRLAWPYFDYLENTNVIAEFLPDSDFGFFDFQQRVMAEYEAAMAV